MSSQNPTGASARLDPLPYMQRLATLAIAVFTEHQSDATHCTVCGSLWPCERIRLADHNLAVL